MQLTTNYKDGFYLYIHAIGPYILQDIVSGGRHVSDSHYGKHHLTTKFKFILKMDDN